MGCSGSKQKPTDVSVPTPRSTSLPGNSSSTTSVVGSTTSVLPHEASAKQLVNAYVRTLLPVLRRGIGMMIVETNEKGGMPLGKDKEHAIYALKIVKPGTSDVTGIDGTTLIESIGVHIKHVELPKNSPQHNDRQFTSMATEDREREAAARARDESPPSQASRATTARRASAGRGAARASVSVSSVKLDEDRVTAERDDVADDETLPAKLREMGLTHAEVIQLDLDLDFRLKFSEDIVEFQIHGERWWSPTLGQFSVKWVRSGEPLRIRAWYASAWKRLFLGFRVPPVVKWDIELSLFRAHIELPDSIEDDWLASELSSRLAQYTLESPLSVSLMPRNDGTESLTKKLYRLGREEIEEEVMEARELKASGMLPSVKESPSRHH